MIFSAISRFCPDPYSLNISFQTASYYLSSEGLIAVNGSQIELLDRDRLQELSDPTKQDYSPS